MLKTSQQQAEQQKRTNRTCPDYDDTKQVCRASIRQMIPSRKQQMRYCGCDDYDDCPVYLSKALRSCRSQGLDRESIMHSGK